MRRGHTHGGNGISAAGTGTQHQPLSLLSVRTRQQYFSPAVFLRDAGIQDRSPVRPLGKAHKRCTLTRPPKTCKASAARGIHGPQGTVIRTVQKYLHFDELIQ